MDYQSTFKRYELKYILTKREKELILKAMDSHMKLDNYGRTTIRNIYFDTDDFRLARRSLEKPVYKEKLRIRSYGCADSDSPVFVELKKKYKSVVYKRRLVMPDEQAETVFKDSLPIPLETQIAEEINYFRQYYKNLKPAVFLSYEREAYYSLDGSDFRVTFDENILYRENELNLGGDIYGTPLLEGGKTLMEIKTSGGYPLWMSHILTELNVYKASFTKYGAAYRSIMANRTKEVCYAC